MVLLFLSGQPLLIRKHDRGFSLAFGDGPVFPQQAILLIQSDEPEAVAFIEPDGPGCSCPGTDQSRSDDLRFKMEQQFAADTLAPRNDDS